MSGIEIMMKRQQVLAAFGEFAIHSEDLDAVLMEACRLVGEATGTGRAKVLEIQEGRQELLVRAGVGWAPDVVGTVRLQMGERSSETYAIKAARPIVTQNIAEDERFDVPYFMKQAGVVAFVNVPIFVPGQRPYGVLQIDDTKPRKFGDDEIEFLRTYAMILGPVIDRLHLVEERARDRELIKANEVRHSLLIGTWAQAVWETDANGVVIADSPSWRAYTGQTLHQWLGYGWLDAIHPDDRSYAERQWREVTAAHEVVDVEFRLRAPDLSWRWTNVRAAPVLDAKGDIERWVGMNIDIDARKRAEASLRESEQRYRRVFSNNMAPMAVWEKSGDITEANDALLELLGYTRAELDAGKLRWDEITPAQYRELDIQAIAEVEATGFCTPYEKVFCHKDGTPISIIIGGGSLDEKAGTGVLFVIDMTASRRAEAALREIEERQAFQLRLSDALASLSNPSDIEAAAARLVAGQLGVSWCYFNEFDDRGTHAIVLGDFHRDGLPSMVGVHDLTGERDFLDLMISGAVLDMPDLTVSEQFSGRAKAVYGAMGIRSALGAPLLRHGRLAAVLLVADTKVRQWGPNESELLRGAAERTWAAIQGARAEVAMRDSGQRQAFLLKLSDAMRDEPTPDAVANRAVRMLFEQIGLDRCYIGIFRLKEDMGELGPQAHAGSLPPMPARVRLSDFPKSVEIASDKTLVINDLREMEGLTDADRANLEGLGFRAILTATVRKGETSPLWAIVAGSMAPRAWSPNEVLLVEEAAERTWAAIERARAQAALGESEARQRALIEGVPQLVWRAHNAGQWTWSSPQWEDFTGQKEEESLGWGWLERIHVDDRQRARQAWVQAVKNGIFEADYRIRDRQGAYRWFQTRAKPIRDETGTAIEWLGTSTDIDDLRGLQERQQMLVAELQHRTFNLMTMVTFMADATIRSSASLGEFSQTFRDRMAALARVQRLLSKLGEDDRVTFDELVRGELEAVGAVESVDGRVTLDGPEGVALRTSTVQVFALALHELTTNAVKYGALNQSSAHLDVSWRVEAANDGEPWLHVDWIETGVLMPASDAKPSGTGQGRSLIEGALPYQLKAKTTYVMGDDGIRCSIALPVSTRTSVNIDDDAE